MEEEFNNNNIENLGENDNYNSPNKRTKFISTRRRKEFISIDSDKKENIQSKNLSSQKKSQEESKEDETDYSKNNRINHFGNNAIERSKASGSPLKDNLTLQEKLKKIFMNRDKLNVQSSIQDIPESLKYNSDDSDDDNISKLRKSNNSKKSNKKEKNDSIRQSKQSELNNRNSNKKEKSEQDGELIFSPPLPGSFGGEEKINKNERRRRFVSYNEEEKTSNENSGSKYDRGNFKWNNKEEAKEKQDNENNENNKKENNKKNALLKMLEKIEKKDKNDNEDETDNIHQNNQRNRYSNRKEIKNEEENIKKEKQQKLLKLLIKRKDSNVVENNNNNDNEINDFKKETPKNKIDIEKENRRRKIIEQLKLESEEKEEKLEAKENKQKENNINNLNKMEKKEEVENDDKDKGTFLSNNHKNRLTISIKPKSNLVKQISKSSIEEKDNDINEDNDIKDENEEEEENPKKNKKANALLDILEKIKKKKSEEKIFSEKENKAFIAKNNENENRNDDINESEIEREKEKIQRQEKKMEERRLARERQKNLPINNKKEEREEKDINYDNFYSDRSKKMSYSSRGEININNNTPIDSYRNNNSIKETECKKTELKRSKRFKEDLKDEKNNYNKEKNDSNIVNSSNINLINVNKLNNSNVNNQINQLENENKSMKKHFNVNLIPNRKPSHRYNNTIDKGSGINGIEINDMPKNNLDRSFDTYAKRKIPTGKNTLNIYRPKRADIRGRSQERNFKELIKNSPNSFNPNKNANFSSGNNPLISYNPANKITYFKKKSSMNDINSFLSNNRSFCEYPKENLNQLEDRNNINMEIELGAGLNSSFDAHMQNNINKNSRNNNYIMNMTNEVFYGSSTKQAENRRYNQNIAPVSNINYNKNLSNSFYKRNNGNDNYNNINRSFGYINNNNFNDKQNQHSIYNKNSFNNNRYNNNQNFNTKTSIANKNNKSFYGMQKKQFITYNNHTSNYCNNSPLKTYEGLALSNTQPENYNNNSNSNNNNNNIYPNTPIPTPTSIPKFPSSKTKSSSNDINNLNSENYINNCTPYPPQSENNTSINIEDLMVLEDKLKEIIIAINKNGSIHNECFEFWNYYYNCSFYGKLEKLFKTENDQNNVQICINHILISVMICYDYSFEMEVLNNETSILVDILGLNHSNLIIIYEHILSKISTESKSNPWVYKLNQLVKNFNNFNEKDNSQYISINGRKLSAVEKIKYNVGIITQNIRVLLKNYKTSRIGELTSIFKKINEKTYEEINTFFRDNILRVDNVKGSVLASVFLKENESFQTEPAPYIKTKNRKPYSLVLDLDETLVHFKINSEDDSEGTLQIRPGIMPFLDSVGKYYELIVFTAATQDYGDLLIDAIEENNVYFEHRFYRQHTVIIGNDFVKDLNRIGRPIDKIIIVDNMPQNFRLQRENGINIKAFWGEDVNDNALEELGKILINIAKDGGDVRIGLERYRDDIVKKVTSNISKSNY